jgi:hypothetical protein
MAGINTAEKAPEILLHSKIISREINLNDGFFNQPGSNPALNYMIIMIIKTKPFRAQDIE